MSVYIENKNKKHGNFGDPQPYMNEESGNGGVVFER